ncbi:MAG: hypothetical protein AAFP69_22425, partial [Planctomycetota bacterium]
YLSALDVSSERFQFDTQFFGGLQTSLDARGRDRGNGNSSTQFAFGTFSNGPRPLAMSRGFATGANLVVGMANNIVWEMSGPNTQTAVTLLDFTLFQPLLRGAGRDVVMERLTLSERRLLSNVRAFERFRRSFYLNITTGRNLEANVRRSGGVFGVGLGGFTGLGGGFAGLGGGGGFGGGGFGTGGGVPQAGGFIGLLQDQLQIRNQEENLARQKENTLLLEATLVELLTTIPDDSEAIPRQRLLVAQSRQSLLSAETTLLARKAAYKSSLDGFLQQMGLPPYICVEIDDPLLSRFNLIDDDLSGLRTKLTEIRQDASTDNLRLLESAETTTNAETGLPSLTIQWNPDLANNVRTLRGDLQPLIPFLNDIVGEDLKRVEADIELLRQAIPDRIRTTQKLKGEYKQRQEMICNLIGSSPISDEVFDTERLQALLDELDVDYKKQQKRFTEYEKEVTQLLGQLEQFANRSAGGDDGIKLAESLRDDIILASQGLLARLSDDVLALQLIQARA